MEQSRSFFLCPYVRNEALWGYFILAKIVWGIFTRAGFEELLCRFCSRRAAPTTVVTMEVREVVQKKNKVVAHANWYL